MSTDPHDSPFPYSPPFLPYESPPRLRPRLTLPAVAAWLVIIAAVGALFWDNYSAAERRTTNAASDRLPAIELRLMGRYVVGARAVLSMAGSAQATKSAGDLTAAIRAREGKEPPQPAELIRTATVLGELAGAEEALAELAKLDGQELAPPLDQDVQTLRRLYREGPETLAAEQQQQLVEHHGWFGELALAYGQPPGSAARDQAIAPAVRTFVALIAAVVGALGAVVVGLVLLIVAGVRWLDGRLRLRYEAALRPTSAFLEAFAVYVGGLVGFALLVRHLWPEAAIWANWLLVIWLPVALFWPRWRGVTWGEWRQGLGWHRGRGVLREMGAGLVGYVAGAPLVALGVLATLLLGRLVEARPMHPIVTQISGAGWWQIIQLYALAAVWAPVTEETLFRGALQHHLRQRWTWLPSAAVVAIIFALLHPQGWTAVPVLGALALAFSGMREWRGSLIAPMTAHAFNNFTAVTLMLVTMG